MVSKKVAKINFQKLTKVLINGNTVKQMRLFQNVITDRLHTNSNNYVMSTYFIYYIQRITFYFLWPALYIENRNSHIVLIDFSTLQNPYLT